MKIFLETERLILREMLLTDAEGMYALDSDPEVHRYLGNRPVKDMAQIIEVIKFVRQQYVENGIGRWAILDRETQEFVGWAGLKLVTEQINGHINYHDLGYRLRKKYWGQGIATECAKACLDYGFETLGLTEIYAAAHIDNIASNKILTNLGFHFIETFDYDGSMHNWYNIVKE